MSATKKKKRTRAQQKWVRDYNAKRLPERARLAREEMDASVLEMRGYLVHADPFLSYRQRGAWAEILLRALVANQYHSRPRARAFVRVCKEIDDAAISARSRDTSPEPKSTEAI
jgi:hypothetical protein